MGTKSKFQVSPVAQHEFRVLGGTRPNGANEKAKAALDQARADRERREAVRAAKAAAKATAKADVNPVSQTAAADAGEEGGVRAMYKRLAAEYDARPTVPDHGGGVPGDRYLP